MERESTDSLSCFKDIYSINQDTMKKFFSSLFNDKNSINEKAVIGFMSFVMMCLFAMVDIVTGALGKPLLINEFIFDSFKILTIASFGIASVDKFITLNKKTKDEEEEVIQ